VRLLALVLAACAATPPPKELQRAEALEHDGKDEEAVAAYARAAEAVCPGVRKGSRGEMYCASALVGRAEALVRLGRKEDAVHAYEQVPAMVPGQKGRAARALSEAAALYLELGESQRAYELYWAVITHYPDEFGADNAVRHVMQDGRTRNARQLYDALSKLEAHLTQTELGDNLLWALAELAEVDLGDPKTALHNLDELAQKYPKSGFRDDALWHGGELARAQGDSEGAVARWRTLLSTRETNIIKIGSLFSVYLDDAQLEVGRVLRDDLGRPEEALAEFQKLPKKYPDSVLKDDALYEIAVTQDKVGRPDAACNTLAWLKKEHPDSRFEVELAPALRARLACKENP